jgi:hypothetical protein
MSDILNHYYCGEMALELIDSDIKKIIIEHKQLFDLGTQGPDFFLYHGIIPWRKHKGYEKYGGLVHHSETNKLIHDMMKYTSSLVNKEEKDKLLSYLMGFACHLSLDSLTHPFIFYHSGVYKKGERATKLYNHYHKEYEMILDALNSKKLGKIASVDFPYMETFMIEGENINMLQDFYEHILKDTIGEILAPNAILDCVSDFMYLFSIFPDKSGRKKKFFGFLENIAGHPHATTKALIQKEFEDTDDYMNLNHKEWLHPCDETIKSSESYVDLFNKAVADTTKKINQLSKLIDSDFTIDDISNIIHNISFETGSVHNYMNGVNKIEMKYCDVKEF